MASQHAQGELAPAGSIREGLVLGALLHVGVQTFFVFVLTATAGLGACKAIALTASYVGVSQLTYIVPAIVDAGVLRSRRLTARGLLMVAMATMGANLLVLRVIAPALTSLT